MVEQHLMNYETFLEDLRKVENRVRYQKSLEEDLIEIFEDLLEKQGFSRMYGRVLAIIYLKEVSMTQAELKKQTNFSRSSINKAVNTLQKLGYIRKKQLGEGKTLIYTTDLGPEEILLSGIKIYIQYFNQIYERFTKNSDNYHKLEGLRAKRLKKFIEHLPEVNKILGTALQEIDKIEFVLKK
ncbi:MAG: MarR family transcriptional regulator [Candidatus Helarchaeota archaeon]